jgi:DNA-binding MarR family transcriptional regulator
VGRLQVELRQGKPFQTPSQEAVVALLRTTDLVGRRLAAVVEPQGLTLQQYNVLRILRGGGAEGVPTLEVAARMIEQTPGITRLLDRLEDKGLVRRQRCQHDRRQHLCWITARGLAALDRLDGPMLATADAVVKPLTRQDRVTLIRLLDLLRSGPLNPLSEHA